jgi:HPt (histidine-containing phosphotransfer) domain-containing protein
MSTPARPSPGIWQPSKQPSTTSGSGALDASGWLAARSAAHRLAGAAGTVGFPEATEPARHLEDAFTDDDLRPDQANLLEAEAAALRKILFGDVPSAKAGTQVCARGSRSPRASSRP